MDARSLKLQQLVEEADRIFRGKVVSVEEQTAVLAQGDDRVEALVREVTIAVDEGLKNVKAGDRLVVKQLVSVSAPLQAGEEVFWFLAEDSELGLTQPLGVYSGDFRIQDSGAGKVANNLRGNAGLWEDSLWTGDGFVRQDVLRAARTLEWSAARVESIEKQAVQRPDNRGISLDLLVAATRSLIKSP